MLTRTFICGVCLLALATGPVMAQTAATQAPTDSPLTVDGATKTPSNIPDIIGTPGTHGDVLQPKHPEGVPGSALTPPNVDPQMPVVGPAHQ
jgi:hypothetical protein